MKVEIGGTGQLKLKMRKMAADVKVGVDAAVAESGRDLLERSLLVTPYEPPGDELRESAYVDNSVPGTSEVGYRSNVAYYVHEMGVTVYPERAPIHWTTPGTGAKFLERPAVENRHRYVDNIRDAVKRAIR